jgi:hypothetical protein
LDVVQGLVVRQSVQPAQLGLILEYLQRGPIVSRVEGFAVEHSALGQVAGKKSLAVLSQHVGKQLVALGDVAEEGPGGHAPSFLVGVLTDFREPLALEAQAKHGVRPRQGRGSIVAHA